MFHLNQYDYPLKIKGVLLRICSCLHYYISCKTFNKIIKSAFTVYLTNSAKNTNNILREN